MNIMWLPDPVLVEEVLVGHKSAPPLVILHVSCSHLRHFGFHGIGLSRLVTLPLTLRLLLEPEAESEDEVEAETELEAESDSLMVLDKCWHSHRSSRDCCLDSPSQVLPEPSS